jgi:hypothetical protein
MDRVQKTTSTCLVYVWGRNAHVWTGSEFLQHVNVSRCETENKVNIWRLVMLQAAVSISMFLLQRQLQLRASRLSVRMRRWQQSNILYIHAHTHTPRAAPRWTHSYQNFLWSGFLKNSTVLTEYFETKESSCLGGFDGKNFFLCFNMLIFRHWRLLSSRTFFFVQSVIPTW